MSAKFNTLRAVASRAVAEGVVPGMVVAVGQGETTSLIVEGARRLEPDERPATEETIYDLASLTKALATSVLLMRAIDAGQIGLSERLGDALPACDGRASGAATVREVLAHASGLPAHRPFYERLLHATGAAAPPPSRGKAALVALAADEPLVAPPSTKSIYSDLGFILLGALLEHRLGRPLDEAFAEMTVDLPGAAALGYAPIGAPPPAWLAKRLCAPTERCPARGRLVEGEVHDLNAFAMGGVAGHAGLFGTAAAVAAVAQALCAAHRGVASDGAPALVGRDVLRAFWSPAGVPGSTWRLGWDGPAPSRSLAGDRLARTAVGHLGFTGCSLWIDPERETFVVVLSNRVHPKVRDDPRFRALRPALNDAALADLGYGA